MDKTGKKKIMAAEVDIQKTIEDDIAAAIAMGSAPAAEAIVARLRRALPPMVHFSSQESPKYVPYSTLNIMAKREFFERSTPRMDDVVDFEKAAGEACRQQDSHDKRAKFRLSESQAFVRNFLNPRTPYNGLLLFHDVGVGKTCAAIQIAQRFQESRKVLILAPLGVHSSFMKQLFDASKGPEMQCTQGSFVEDFVPSEPDLASKEPERFRAELEAHALKKISTRYTLSGFNKFANTLGKMSDAEVRAAYSDLVVIVDEAHNLRTQQNSMKPSYRALKRLLTLCRGTKLVLLTATPMFNDPREIVDLVNLLIVNDFRSEVTPGIGKNGGGGNKILSKRDLFDDQGVLVRPELLEEAVTGYVSYVSGRNPLRFPIMLWPDANGDEGVLKDEDRPRLDISGHPLPKSRKSSKSKRVVILGSRMSPIQYEKYLESGPASSADMLGEAGAAGGEFDESIGDDIERVRDDDDSPNDSPNDSPHGRNQTTSASFQACFEAANVAFPSSHRDHRGRRMTSSGSFWSCFRQVQGQGRDFSVEYIEDRPSAVKGGFLAPGNLAVWSCKFDAIVKRIQGSTGIVFVYSRFLWAGLVPLAIALEQSGFSRHGQRNILIQSQRQDQNRIQNTPENRTGQQYILLTSDTRLCTKARFARDLDAANSPDNARGSMVKVILACGVAAEGIDFKCVREVHLLDPWYHSNKVRQIIGRASRNCSHALLPVSERNVTVYLHAALPSHEQEGEEQRETIDLHAYRISEQKQARIDLVEDVLKRASVDCELNRHVQQEEALSRTTADIVTSQGTRIVRYRLSDSFDSAGRRQCRVAHDAAAGDRWGTDLSTYDPLYHSRDILDDVLQDVLNLFRKENREAMDYDDVRDRILGSGNDKNSRDELILKHALQVGIDAGSIAYRGGMYTRNPDLDSRGLGSDLGSDSSTATPVALMRPVAHAPRKK